MGGCVVVDPCIGQPPAVAQAAGGGGGGGGGLAAALVQLSGGPAAGEGASAAIYDWLGTRALPAFPPTVVNVVSPLIYRICAPKK